MSPSRAATNFALNHQRSPVSAVRTASPSSLHSFTRSQLPLLRGSALCPPESVFCPIDRPNSVSRRSAHTMFLRSVARAAPRSSALPTSAIRSAPGPMACLNARAPAEQSFVAPQQTRAASDHAIANPTLASIEKRWEGMPPQEQAELWMQLRDRMKVDWHQLTLQEKKAGRFPPASC